jgi:hypothetical protein
MLHPSRRLQCFWIKVDADLDRLLTAGTTRIKQRLFRIEFAYTSSTERMTTSKYTPVFFSFTAALTGKEGEISPFVNNPL